MPESPTAVLDYAVIRATVREQARIRAEMCRDIQRWCLDAAAVLPSGSEVERAHIEGLQHAAAFCSGAAQGLEQYLTESETPGARR